MRLPAIETAAPFGVVGNAGATGRCADADHRRCRGAYGIVVVLKITVGMALHLLYCGSKKYNFQEEFYGKLHFISRCCGYFSLGIFF